MFLTILAASTPVPGNPSFDHKWISAYAQDWEYAYSGYNYMREDTLDQVILKEVYLAYFFYRIGDEPRAQKVSAAIEALVEINMANKPLGND